MTETALALVLWFCPVSDSFTLVLHEKYGAPIVYTNANLVMDYQGAYYVTCRGKLVGTFPKDNYSIERR